MVTLRPRGVRSSRPICIRYGSIKVLDGAALLGGQGGQRFDAYRAAVIIFDDRFKQAAVGGVEPQFVDIEQSQGLVAQWRVDDAVTVNVGVVPDALQQPVGDARRQPRTLGQLVRRRLSILTLRMPAARSIIFCTSSGV